MAEGLAWLDEQLGAKPGQPDGAPNHGLAWLDEQIKKPKPPSFGERALEFGKTAVRPLTRAGEAGGREIIEGARELNPFGRGTEGPVEAASRTLGGAGRILNAPVAAAGEFLASPALETEVGQRRPSVGGFQLPSVAEALRAVGQAAAAVGLGIPRETPRVIGPREAPRGAVAAGGRDWPGTEPLALPGPPGVNWQYGRRGPVPEPEARVVRSWTEPPAVVRELPSGPTVAGELPPHVNWRRYEGPEPTIPRGAPELPPHIDWRRYEGPPPPEQMGLELSGTATAPTPESVAAGTPETASGAPAGPPPSSAEAPPKLFTPKVEVPTRQAPPPTRQGTPESAGLDLGDYDQVAKAVRRYGRIQVGDYLRGEHRNVPWHFKSAKGMTIDRMAESLLEAEPWLEGGDRAKVAERILDTLSRGRKASVTTGAPGRISPPPGVPDWVTEDQTALTAGEQVVDNQGRPGTILAIAGPAERQVGLVRLDSGEHVGVPLNRLTRPGEVEAMGFSSPSAPRPPESLSGPLPPGERPSTPPSERHVLGEPDPQRAAVQEWLADQLGAQHQFGLAGAKSAEAIPGPVKAKLEGLGISPDDAWDVSHAPEPRAGAMERLLAKAMPKAEPPALPPGPRFEPTQTGMQGVIGGTPARELPNRPLKPPTAQASVEETPLFGQERAARQRVLEESQGDLTKPPDPETNPFTDEAGRLDLASMVKTWKRWRDKLPMEKEVIRQKPDSPVINETERYNVGMADGMGRVVDEPWWKGARPSGKFFRRGGVQQMNPDVLKDLEATAHNEFVANGKTRQAGINARRHFPPEVQQYFRQRDAALARENASRKYFGLDPIPEEWGPYLPRRTVAESREAVSLGGGQLGVGRGLQTTVGGHQNTRIYPTYRAGEAAGLEYLDPRNSILYREWEGIKVRSTHRLFQNLERNGGLFRRQADAQAANPTGKPWHVENAPGGPWWASSEAEAKFLEQNLTDSGTGSTMMQVFTHYANQLIRNPNLLLGVPHVTKNMWWKGLLARGPEGLYTFPRDAVEYFKRWDPALRAEFEATMPFSKTGRTAGDMIGENLIRETNLGKAAQAVGNVLRTAGRPSNKLVFEWGDPAMRYSLFKYYRGKGLAPHAAANEAWVDLVRYGTRGDMIDAWKKWPMNFFVPWRWGTFTSLLKQAKNHPVRTALLIGAVDYVREANYRQRGKWFHMPHDYVENPIAISLQDRDPAVIGGIAITTYMFGPGGAFTASQIADVMNDARGRGDYQRFVNMFWGVSQMYNLGKEGAEFLKTHDPKIAYDILGTALLAEHNAMNYQPRRLGPFFGIPKLFPGGEEWVNTLPGMTKSPQVRQAEAIQAKRQAVREKIELRRKVRPRPSIDEIVGARP